MDKIHSLDKASLFVVSDFCSFSFIIPRYWASHSDFPITNPIPFFRRGLKYEIVEAQ